ncbi:MAG: aminodeoxychorismate/anthranilate synthase component II [Lachnospiraceae bacterium]|jgi:anthranilate synthase component 2|nr:aminodeoxychorismate/anthranilate synthase component II [Lachnospiraceae bacterium]
MILLIDNYDSFSYNLYQFIGAINKDIKVIRNDELAIDEIDDLNPSHIVISPGPGKPCDAGICEEVIRSLQSRYPILGVCLGHQAICEVYGATIDHASRLMHGKMSIAHVDNESKLFKGLERDIEVARYHSLAAVKDTIPDCLKITAMTDDGEVMAVEHKDHKVFGVQFHPESILTPDGMTMIRNFLS